MADKERIYRISFINKGEAYEIYAKGIAHGDLFGFLEIEDIIWGNNTSMVIDPSEERLRNEFKGVTCTFIPMHAVNRIDEVEKTGVAKITSIKGSNITPFPTPIYTPTNNTDSAS